MNEKTPATREAVVNLRNTNEPLRALHMVKEFIRDNIRNTGTDKRCRTTRRRQGWFKDKAQMREIKTKL